MAARAAADGAPGSKDGEAETDVALSGYVQADLVPWDQASVDEPDADGSPLNRERVLVRRARLHAALTRDRYFASLELDGNTVSGATARVVDARVGARWRGRGVQASLALGLFKLPFGREVPASEATREVLEPTLAARAFFPGSRDAGLLAEARWRGVELAVALVNGAPTEDAQFRGRDPSSSWDLLGRAGGRGTLRYGVELSGGVSLLTGTGLHPGTPPIKEALVWVDANEDGLVQTTELLVVPGAPATPSETFTRSGVGADVAITWCLQRLGGGRAAAEVTLGTNLDRGVEYADPIVADRDLRELGWHVLVVQSITRHAAIAARYDAYRPDRDAFELRGAGIVPTDPRYTTLAIAGELRHGSARFLVEYDHERNPRGRGLDGAPTTRAADRVTLRAQVAF